MPDYMYLLESQLSPEQRAALLRVQELARIQESNIYLTGGAVRDLLSGMPVRNLDFTVEGNPARIIHELRKGGARILAEDERLRHYDLIFLGDVDGSISSARDEHYARPGARPETRWSTIMEDLRRRDFSVNAIAISLNPASRGLLLDPTNGVADLERHEIRALSIHAFTNQPIRLLRALRFCARMNFKMEQRSQEWYELALERGLPRTIEPRDAGREILDLAREDSAVAVLKLWEAKGLLDVVYPALKRRKPDYEKIKRLVKVRDTFAAAGLKVRLAVPTLYYIFRRLKARGMATALYTLDFPSGQATRIVGLPVEAKKLLAILRGSKTKEARHAYEVISSAPTELLAFVDVEFRDAKVTGKIRNYLTKWRPLHQRLPAAELEALGISRGTKFDKILGELFELQLRGRGKTPEDVTKLLRRLAGIKEEPKKQPKDEKGTRPRTAAFLHKKRLGKAAAGASSLGKEPPSRLPHAREESAGTVAGRESPKAPAASSSKKTIQKHTSGHGNLRKRAARRR